MSQELLITSEKDDIEETIIKLKNENKWYNVLLRNFCNFWKMLWTKVKTFFSYHQNTSKVNQWYYAFDGLYDEENPFYQEPDFYIPPMEEI